MKAPRKSTSRKSDSSRTRRDISSAAVPGDPLDDDSGADAGYEVGYGRPPVHSRFKSGQSGNPKGRPKGARSLQDMASQALRKQRKVTLQGKPVRMPALQIMITSVAERAMRGDLAALRALMPLILRSLDTTEGVDALSTLPEDDRALLVGYIQKLQAQTEAKGRGRP